MSPNEQETTFTYDSGQKIVRIFSARPVDQRKIERAGFKPLASKGNVDTGLFYEVPLARFTWRIKPICGAVKSPARVLAGQRLAETRKKAKERAKST